MWEKLVLVLVSIGIGHALFMALLGWDALRGRDVSSVGIAPLLVVLAISVVAGVGLWFLAKDGKRRG